MNPLDWSGDGKYLFVTSQPASVWRVPVSGGEMTNIGIRVDGVIKRVSHGPAPLRRGS